MLLAFVLVLSVLGSCMSACWPSKGSATLCDVEEEGLEECLEDLAEEQIDAGADFYDIDFPRVLGAAYVVETSQQLTGACQAPAPCYAFGWMLPLRI